MKSYTSLAQIPAGRFRVICADPPWAVSTARKHYATMPAKMIAALDVERIAQDNAMLFLWAPWNMVKDAIGIMGKWGFEYKTMGFVWVKPEFELGLGNYTRLGSEACLLGRRGKGCPVKRHDVRQVLQQPRGQHSRKPLAFLDRIDRLFGDVPRIELFGRGPPKMGWDIHGDQTYTQKQIAGGIQK